MHFKLKLLATLFSTLALTAAIGEEKVLLKQTLQAGKTYELEQEMKMNSQISIPGTDEAMEQNMKMNMGMELVVAQSKPEEKSVSVKYTGMKMSIEMMGQTMEMDASDPAQKQTLGPIMDINPVLVFDNKDEFLRMENVEELGADNPLAGAVDPDQLSQTVGGMMGALPEEPVAPGHKWESKEDMSIPNMGKIKMVISNEFTKYETINGSKCAVIDFTGTFNGEIEQQGMTMKIKKGSEFTGTYYFDPAVGYSQKQEINMNLIMGMDMAGETMEIPMSINQTVDLVKITDNAKVGE